MDRLTALEVLVAIVDSGGFGRAAERLGMSPAMVSTHVARLEDRLRTRLIHRSTRRFALTPEGHQFVDDARRILEARLTAARAASTTGLLPALEALVQAKSATPAAVIQALNFHNGTVELKVAAPDAASLDRMGQALRTTGWQADLTSGSNVSNGYEGHLQLHQ